MVEKEPQILLTSEYLMMIYDFVCLYIVSGKKSSTSRAQPKSIMANSGRTSSNGKQQYREPSSQQPIHNQNLGSQPRKNSITGPNMNHGPHAGPNSPANSEMVPSYMRSTSASTKKSLSSVPINSSPQYQHPQISGHLANRHLSNRAMMGQAQSTSDIRQAIKDEDSSSDEETSGVSSNRRRSSSHDR